MMNARAEMESVTADARTPFAWVTLRAWSCARSCAGNSGSTDENTRVAGSAADKRARREGWRAASVIANTLAAKNRVIVFIGRVPPETAHSDSACGRGAIANRLHFGRLVDRRALLLIAVVLIAACHR